MLPNAGFASHSVCSGLIWICRAEAECESLVTYSGCWAGKNKKLDILKPVVK